MWGNETEDALFFLVQVKLIRAEDESFSCFGECLFLDFTGGKVGIKLMKRLTNREIERERERERKKEKEGRRERGEGERERER